MPRLANRDPVRLAECTDQHTGQHARGARGGAAAPHGPGGAGHRDAPTKASTHWKQVRGAAPSMLTAVNDLTGRAKGGGKVPLKGSKLLGKRFDLDEEGNVSSGRASTLTLTLAPTLAVTPTLALAPTLTLTRRASCTYPCPSSTSARPPPPRPPPPPSVPSARRVSKGGSVRGVRPRRATPPLRTCSSPPRRRVPQAQRPRRRSCALRSRRRWRSPDP